MRNRKQKMKELGYTDEQIENHYKYARYKAKIVRDERKRNNEKNKEVIYKMKKELLNKKFIQNNRTSEVISLRPSVDGRGAWVKVHKTFPDGSEGNFRDFIHFDDYNKKEVISYMFM